MRVSLLPAPVGARERLAGGNYFGLDGDPHAYVTFNFQVDQDLCYALALADTRPRQLKATKQRPATDLMGIFLRNHDELDLDRLTEDQGQAAFATLAGSGSLGFTGYQAQPGEMPPP